MEVWHRASSTRPPVISPIPSSVTAAAAVVAGAWTALPAVPVSVSYDATPRKTPRAAMTAPPIRGETRRLRLPGATLGLGMKNASPAGAPPSRYPDAELIEWHRSRFSATAAEDGHRAGRAIHEQPVAG